MKSEAIGVAVCFALLATFGCERAADSREANRQPGRRSAAVEEVAPPGRQRHAGDAAWQEKFSRTPGKGCDLGAISGPDADASAEKDSEDCLLSQLHVRNLSPRPIQCHVSKRLPARDASNQRWLEQDAVVFPGHERVAASTRGPVASAPEDLAADCEIYPPGFVRVVVPSGCKLNVESFPNPGDFYPGDALRRGVEGSVVLEFNVQGGGGSISAVRVVVSSGSEDFDEAALRMSRLIRARSPCSGQRYNLKIRFVIQPGPRGTDGLAVEKPG
jgi:TonB family protein